MVDRGQLYTLEGIFAGLVILLGLFFAIQATTTTPSAAGASNPHAIQDDDVYVEDVLASMNRSTLKEAVLYWDTDDGFHCTPSGVSYYTGFWDTGTCSSSSDYVVQTNDQHPPPNRFGNLLEERLGDQYGYNVRIAYDDGGTLRYQRMVYQGEPGVGAVRSSTSVVLLNDDQLRTRDGGDAGTLADNAGDFYAPPSDGDAGDDDAYNVVHVEVVIWRG